MILNVCIMRSKAYLFNYLCMNTSFLVNEININHLVLVKYFPDLDISNEYD